MFSRQGRRLPWTDEGSMFEMVGGGERKAAEDQDVWDLEYKAEICHHPFKKPTRINTIISISSKE